MTSLGGEKGSSSKEKKFIRSVATTDDLSGTYGESSEARSGRRKKKRRVWKPGPDREGKVYHRHDSSGRRRAHSPPAVREAPAVGQNRNQTVVGGGIADRLAVFTKSAQAPPPKPKDPPQPVGKLTDKIAAFNKPAEETPPPPKQPPQKVGKLTDKLDAFNKPAETPIPRKDSLPKPGKLTDKLDAFTKLPEAPPPRKDSLPKPGKLGSRIDAIAKQQEDDRRVAAERRPAQTVVPGQMTMAERMAQLAKPKEPVEEGSGQETPANGEVGREAFTVPPKPKPAEPEKDSDMTEVVAAPTMAVRGARRVGGRRPGALRELE